MLKTFKNRVSVRNFKDYKLSKKNIANITSIINSTPTSTNSVQFSAILIYEKSGLEFFAKLTGQKYIATSSGLIVFIADRTRMLVEKTKKHSKNFMFHDYIRAFQDASIAGGITNDGLIQMGFGTTFIGNLTSSGDEVAKELKIPDTAFPVLGLVFGKSSHKNQIKPKLNRVFENEYSIKKAHSDYKNYNEQTMDYYKSINHPSYAEQTRSQVNPNKAWEKRFTEIGKYLWTRWEKFK